MYLSKHTHTGWTFGNGIADGVEPRRDEWRMVPGNTRPGRLGVRWRRAWNLRRRPLGRGNSRALDGGWRWKFRRPLCPQIFCECGAVSRRLPLSPSSRLDRVLLLPTDAGAISPPAPSVPLPLPFAPSALGSCPELPLPFCPLPPLPLSPPLPLLPLPSAPVLSSSAFCPSVLCSLCPSPRLSLPSALSVVGSFVLPHPLPCSLCPLLLLPWSNPTRWCMSNPHSIPPPV